MELELLVVVERQHGTLLRLEGADGLAEQRDLLLVVDLRLDAVVGAAGEQVAGGVALLLVIVLGAAVERHLVRPLEVALPAPERGQVDVEALRDFRIGRQSAEFARERLAGPADVARLATHRARHVILATQLVEHGPANARRGKGRELQPALRVEVLECTDQAERAGADQLVELRLVSEAGGQLPGDEVDETNVGVEELGTGSLISASVAVPEGRMVIHAAGLPVGR